jgi:hypothetical protein
MKKASLLPTPLRLKVLDHPPQDAGAGVRIRQLDMLVRVMADAAAATDEDHADIGDVDHRHAVMPGSALQLEHAKAFGSDCVCDLRLQPGRAGRGAVLMGDIDL